MVSRFPRLVVAGMKGGSGKTTVSLGLIAAWQKDGLSVRPYKKGPDYIDAGWLSSAAGRECYNLDPFLISQDRIISSFIGHFNDSDCAVIEGNRGLYDGMDAEGTFSTAELSKTLRAPVLLVLDCTKVTRTVAAMVLGMRMFDRKVAISGVVLNQIAGGRHERIIRDAIEKYCGVQVLGAIPRMHGEFLSERHMGLLPFQEHPEVRAAISHLEETARQYLDLGKILQMARDAGPVPGERRNRPAPPFLHVPAADPGVAVGIIRDSAFQFYYPENFEELTKRGARLIEINALTDKGLPDVDALYIGGGFPETNAVALAKNAPFRRSLLKAVKDGLPVYAECGGLMYLGRSLLIGNRTFPMAGVFPLEFCLEKKPQAHGYTMVEVSGPNPFYPVGTLLKGHEFHYSKVIGAEKGTGMDFAFKMNRGNGIMAKKDGVCYNNVLATYTHLHAYGSPEWAEGMIQSAVLYKKRKAGHVGKRENRRNTVRT